MKMNRKRVGWIVAFAALPGACIAEAPETGAESGSGTAADVSANANVESVPAQADTNRVVFRDQFADGGELMVVKDDRSRISFSVEAPIGSAAETLLKRAHAVPSLKGVYAMLHEGKQPVPAALAALSAEVEAATPAKVAQAERLVTPELEGNVMYGPMTETVSVPKSKSAFMSGYCKEFIVGDVSYKPGPALQWCYWDNTRNTMCLSFIYNYVCSNGTCTYVNSGSCAPYGTLKSNDSTLIDRAYGWNANSTTATMAIFGGFEPANNSWRPTVSAYKVKWIQWGGTYRGANAAIFRATGLTGELGLTSHTASFR